MTDQPNSIYHLIRSSAARAPESHVILAHDRHPMNWVSLRQQVDHTLDTLHRAGLGRGSRVVVVLPNGPEMAVTFLAVASGMTAAPLNPSYREADFEFYLTDLEADAVIVASVLDSPVRNVARKLQVPIIELETESKGGLFCLKAVDVRGPGPSTLNTASDIALILHTSGTTSRPKMVPLSSTNLCTSAFNIKKSLSLGPQDRCLNIMPLFHIHGLIANVLGSLAGEGSIVCTPGLDGQQFFHWYDTLQPTWYSAVPTMHQAILQVSDSHAQMIAAKPLRFIRSSSASLPPTVMRQLETTFRCPVIEAYGMTEAAHQMTSNPLPPGRRKPRSVGLPAGPEIAILDKAGTVLNRGETGEVSIRGANVTSGYLANPAANDDAFFAGWFRTGDQGYLDEDGYLFLTGRLKEIINRGGEKVTPREIDEALMDHPDVKQAVAFAIPHPTLGDDVAAAVVLRPQALTTAQDLREFAFEKLSDFKVPSQIVLVETIPKGPTGKLQRIGLVDKLTELLQVPFVAPRDKLETVLAGICCDVLQRELISMSDNFFALGGDSLRATQAMARIRAILQLDLPISTIFRKPTIAEFADEIRPKLPTLDWIGQATTDVEELSNEASQQLLTQQLDPPSRTGRRIHRSRSGR